MTSTLLRALAVLAVGSSLCSYRAVAANDAPPSAVEARMAQQERASTNSWLILPYRPTYVLPVTYNTHVNNEPLTDSGIDGEGQEFDPVEIKFQISFMLPLVDDMFAGNGDLYMAYTQVSFWQAYNSDNSAPFRDTNYEPEFFMKFDMDRDVLGLDLNAVMLGAVHQSNGRGTDVMSRSWNRLYANILLAKGNFGLAIKPWYRIPEDEEEDNNPDIDHFLGYGEVRGFYKAGSYVTSVMVRNNLDVEQNLGCVEVDWSFPISRNLKGLLQYFNGYGENLLDYDQYSQRFGIGVMLSDWL